jgi:uncharacterized membrane protein
MHKSGYYIWSWLGKPVYGGTENNALESHKKFFVMSKVHCVMAYFILILMSLIQLDIPIVIGAEIWMIKIVLQVLYFS